MIYDRRTGQFVTIPNPAERVSEIEHEMTMRALGDEPYLYPDADLQELHRFYKVLEEGMQ